MSPQKNITIVVAEAYSKHRAMSDPSSYRAEDAEEDPPFAVRATVGMSSSAKNAQKTEIVARQSMSTFVLKMLLCKQANVNESDYDLRFKGRIVPTSTPNVTLRECGITKETTSGVSLWENEACRRRKVADELDAIRREKREQFYDGANAREEARREIERIKAKNSYASESTGIDGGGTLERQDTSRYGYVPSSSSSSRAAAAAAAQRQPPAAENPYQQSQQHQQYHHRVHRQQHHVYPNANNITDHNHHDESPIVIDDTSDAAHIAAAAAESTRRRDAHSPLELDDLTKRRLAADQLQKIIADVDALTVRVDDILDVHKNDPSLISDELKKTTLKNSREAMHLLEKSLLRADAVESHGLPDIRAMRKGLVARVENICGKLEPLTKEDAEEK